MPCYTPWVTSRFPNATVVFLGQSPIATATTMLFLCVSLELLPRPATVQVLQAHACMLLQSIASLELMKAWPMALCQPLPTSSLKGRSHSFKGRDWPCRVQTRGHIKHCYTCLLFSRYVSARLLIFFVMGVCSSFFTSTSTATLHVVFLQTNCYTYSSLCVCVFFLLHYKYCKPMPGIACMLLQSIASLELMKAWPMGLC